LAGRKIAKTGNAPAVTKNQQLINIGKGVVLLDTPGVLWPNVENKNSGYRLAATGAIKDTVLELTEVAYFVAMYLLSNYPNALTARYALGAAPADPVALLDAVGKKRGCLAKGGIVDYDRTSQLFIKDLRAGDLGAITLETPEIFAAESSAQMATKTQTVDRQQARKTQRRGEQQARRNHKKQS
jgi:ribosome biogenesis GTPase A